MSHSHLPVCVSFKIRTLKMCFQVVWIILSEFLFSVFFVFHLSYFRSNLLSEWFSRLFNERAGRQRHQDQLVDCSWLFTRLWLRIAWKGLSGQNCRKLQFRGCANAELERDLLDCIRFDEMNCVSFDLTEWFGSKQLNERKKENFISEREFKSLKIV